MALTLIELDSPSLLLRHQQNILQLFKSVFNRQLDKELWEWYYLQQPFEYPIVTIAYENDRIIGHYALIPVSLYNDNGDKIKASQSITTMIDSRFADLRLFETLANATYERAIKKGWELVFGFPNQNSRFYFQRVLKWHIHANDFIALTSVQNLKNSKEWIEYYQDRSRYHNEMSNPEYTCYRLKKPVGNIAVLDGNIVKSSSNGLDLLQPSLANLDTLDNTLYHIYIDGTIKGFDDLKAFDYPFGGRWLDDPKRALPKFQKQMLLSDVF